MIQLWEELVSYFPSLWKHRWWGMWTALLVGVLGVAVTMALPDRYEANARVQLDTQTILNPLMDGLAVKPNVDQQVQMLGRTLVSRPNVEQVLAMTGIAAGADAAERDRTIVSLLKEIKLRTAAGSNIYSIVFRDDDPETAKKVVESLLDIFQQKNFNNQQRDSGNALTFIDEQLAVYRKRLTDAENAVKDFKVRNLQLMPNLERDYVTRTAEAQRDLAQARLELRQLESSRDAFRAQLANEAPTLESRGTDIDGLPDGSGADGPSPAEARLDAARKQLDGLLLRFTDEHPDVIRARQTIRELEQRRDAQQRSGRPEVDRQSSIVPNKVYQDLKLSLAATESKIAQRRARIDEAQKWLAEARTASATIPMIEAQYSQLNRDYEINKKSYDKLLERREKADVSGQMGSGSGIGAFRVVDPPYVGSRPATPNRPLLLVLVLLVSVAVGVVMTFLRDAAVPTFRDVATLREHTGLPLLGSVTLNPDAAARSLARRAVYVFSTGAAMYVGAFVVLIALVIVTR